MLDLKSPVIFSVEITNKCNLRCFGCGNIFKKEKDILSLCEWKKIFDQIKPYAKIIRLTGGEPTLHPDFFEILEVINKMDVSLNIFTNALWEDKVEFVKKLKNFSNHISFLISFHGLSSDSFSKFSGKGFTAEVYDKIVENIKYAVHCGFEVSTSTVIGLNNHMELERLTNFLLGIGVKSLIFERYLGKDLPGISFSDEQLQLAVSELNRLRQSGYPVAIGNCIPHCFFSSSFMGCSAGAGFGTIDPWGNMRPCSHSTKILGNLLTEKIENIWNGNELKKWRRDIPKECGACAHSYVCSGGCRANAEMRGEKKDFLITGKVPKIRQKQIPVTLNEDLFPNFIGDVRKEEKGYLLVNKNGNFIFINDNLFRIIDFIRDSKTDLRGVEKKFSGKGLSFLYTLYAKGFITFNKDSYETKEKVVPQ